MAVAVHSSGLHAGTDAHPTAVFAEADDRNHLLIRNAQRQVLAEYSAGSWSSYTIDRDENPAEASPADDDFAGIAAAYLTTARQAALQAMHPDVPFGGEAYFAGLKAADTAAAIALAASQLVHS